MMEMQGIKNMNCTLWAEGVREILSAENTETKFIVTDHPVTIFNHAYPPDHTSCGYPNDPSIALKGSQTLFPMNKDLCLVLSNLEYAEAPADIDPTEKRTFSKNFRSSMVRVDSFIRERKLSDEEVARVNYILKSRARRYIAAGKKEWLFPERHVHCSWEGVRDVLLPPSDHLWQYGGEMYARFEDGSVYYQDKFGRTEKPYEHLQKKHPSKEPKPNDYCRCGSGKKYKKCCKKIPVELRPSWSELSIRERNILLFNGITNVLGLQQEHDWVNVRRNLTSDQISKIYRIFASLWPPETDLPSLLPKPDGTARALFTGIVDPRLVTEFLVGSTLYFGEIIVQNPMIHPRVVKEEFSPTEKPEQFRQEVIKNVVLLMTLMPLIEIGAINFIPDPCIFDHHLRDQMFALAQERTDRISVKLDDDPRFKWAQKNDMRRSVQALPVDFQRKRILEMIPEISDDAVEEILCHIRKENEQDPLSPLVNESIALSQEGGNFLTFNLSPNLEMSLYIAQLTGSFVVTDSMYRWQELLACQQHDLGIIVPHAPELTALIGKVEHRFAMEPFSVSEMLTEGHFREYHRFTQELYDAVTTPTPFDDPNGLKRSFESALAASNNEFERHGIPTFKGKMNCAIPRKGITHNNTLRMLLANGQDQYSDNVPMAFYMSREDIEVYESPLN